jgi:hypothetical protein
MLFAGDSLITPTPNTPFYSANRINSFTASPHGPYHPTNGDLLTGVVAPAIALETVCDNKLSLEHCFNLFAAGDCNVNGTLAIVNGDEAGNSGGTGYMQ